VLAHRVVGWLTDLLAQIRKLAQRQLKAVDSHYREAP